MPGYFCPTGSTNSSSVSCPAGKYGGVAGLANATCSGSLALFALHCCFLTFCLLAQVRVRKATTALGHPRRPLSTSVKRVTTAPLLAQRARIATARAPSVNYSVVILCLRMNLLVVKLRFVAVLLCRLCSVLRLAIMLAIRLLLTILNKWICQVVRFAKSNHLSAGYFCTAASTSATEFPCPAGSLSSPFLKTSQFTNAHRITNRYIRRLRWPVLFVVHQPVQRWPLGPARANISHLLPALQPRCTLVWFLFCAVICCSIFGVCRYVGFSCVVVFVVDEPFCVV